MMKVKSLIRRAQCYKTMNKIVEAARDYESAVEIQKQHGIKEGYLDESRDAALSQVKTKAMTIDSEE